MKTLRIESVDVVRDGVVVTYSDGTSAFYHEAVLMTHLAASAETRRKPVQRAATHTVQDQQTA